MILTLYHISQRNVREQGYTKVRVRRTDLYEYGHYVPSAEELAERAETHRQQQSHFAHMRLLLQSSTSMQLPN